jgi:predicted lipid-binding transport protein (Tim44 family)
VRHRARNLLAIFAALLAPAAALARVGGGGGFSGGGHGHSGGGDGDAGLIFALVRVLFWLVFREPVIGIPLLILVIVVLVRMKLSGGLHLDVGENATTLSSSQAGGAWTAPALRGGPVNLTPVRSSDPFFSEPVFVDFAQLVYVRAQEMRGTGNRDAVVPWMAQEAIDKLFADRVNLESTSDVILGATKIVQAATDGGFVIVDVSYEANVTERRSGATQHVLCDERWSFRRKAGVHSPAPDKMRALGCPGCGSTEEPKTDGTCPSCGAPRTGGLAQWEVVRIPYANRRPLSPPEMPQAGGVEEGTDLPTVYDPRFQSAKRAFEGKHPDHSWSAFDERVRATFLALQKAWSSRDWGPARPYESDALYQTHRYWLERYESFGLTNKVEQVEVLKVVPVKIDTDAYYEAIAVRIYARALDWTADKDGKTVSGNPKDPTTFSEYWTFLRAAAGAPTAPRVCPSCGAPVEQGGQAIVCGFCGSKLGGGAFEWVVSRIEQDDAYAG